MILPTYTKVAKVEGDLKGAQVAWNYTWSGTEQGIPAPNILPSGQFCLVTNQAIEDKPFVVPNAGVLTLTPTLVCGEGSSLELDPITLTVGVNFVPIVSQPCCIEKIDPSECNCEEFGCSEYGSASISLVDGQFVLNGATEWLSPQVGVGVMFDNGFIRVRMFGWGNGSYGLGGSMAIYPICHISAYDFSYDPSGTGNYGVSDYLAPGDPSECFEFWVKKNGIWSYIERDNQDNVDVYYGIRGSMTIFRTSTGVGGFSTFTCSDGSNGAVLVEHEITEGVPAFHTKHTFLFDSDVEELVVGRGIDPDPDFNDYGTYKTVNSIGLGSIPQNRIAVSYGAVTGRPMSIYTPPGNYETAAAINHDWHDYNKMYDLGSYNDGSLADNAIDLLWKVRNIKAGVPVSICCHYVCGLSEQDLIGIFGG